MKRRNLVIGLGAMTIGSAATALTGASVSNAVSPSADFRVNVGEPGLEVVRGPGFDSTTNDIGQLADGSHTTANNYTANYIKDDSGEGVTTLLADENGFAAAANDSVNGNLEFGVSIPLDAIPTFGAGRDTSVEEGVVYVFPDLLQINNTGFEPSGNVNNAKAVGIRYDAGNGDSADTTDNGFVTSGNNALNGDGNLVSPTGDSTPFSFDQAAALFGFYTEYADDNGDTSLAKISSLGGTSSDANSNQKPANGIRIENNKGIGVDLHVSINSSFGVKLYDDITDNVGATGGNVRIIDKIYVNAMDSTENDLAGGTGGSEFYGRDPSEYIDLS